MNETIGVKGGKNDIRRHLIITKQEKKKLEIYQKSLKEKELIELEKKVKLNQKITFLKILPIITIGQVVKTILGNDEEKKKLIIEDAIYRIQNENIFSEKEKEKIISAIKNGNILSLPEDILNLLSISKEIDNKVDESSKEQISIKNKETVSKTTQVYIQKIIELNKEKETTNENEISNEKASKKHSYEEQHINQNNLEIEKQLDKLKNKRIIDEYEKQLKDIRVDLRKLTFEYDVIRKQSENLYDSKEAEKLLERLNDIIRKIEELQKRMEIPNYEKYDDNYLYVLVEDYIEDFKNHKFIEEIKDSSLYIMISEKLDELDKKKDSLQAKIEEHKEKLEIDEDKFETIKEEYFNYEKFSNMLTNFENSQENILKQIEKKISSAISVQEKVETQVVTMRKQTKKLLKIMAICMMLPGARSAKGLATATVIYLNFMKKFIKPSQPKTKISQVIKVEDYSKDIENSIEQLENISKLLKNTAKEIDITIKDFEEQFKEYIDILPECKRLLHNLESVKEKIKEKELELEKIKKEQEKNLDKNNSKIKMYNKQM